MTDALIIRGEVFRLSHEVRSVRSHGIGDIAGSFETVLLRLEDEAGHVGWGEATPWAPFCGTPEAAFAALSRYIGPLAIGRGAQDWRALCDLADARLAGHPDAKAAFETALLDLHGIASGQPLWSILGEKTRDNIPLSISIADPEWSRDLELIERAWDSGIRLFKLKAGFREGAYDIERIEDIRARWPDANVRLDYNQGLSVARAMEDVPQVDGLGLDFIEQPVRAHEWGAMAGLRAKMATPLVADESIFSAKDFANAAPWEMADGVSVKVMKAGGPAQAHRLAEVAMAAGWRAYGGDMFETGISHLAGVHMIAASAGFEWGCEFYHARWHVERDTLAMPFCEAGGRVVVPEGPGLSAAVDEGYVRRAAVTQVKFGD